VALVFAIRERPHPHAPQERAWSVRGLPAGFWKVIALIGVFGLVNFPDTLLLLRAKDLGFDFSGVVVLYVLYNLTYAAGSYPAGLVSDRLSRPVVVAGGLGVFSLTYLGFGLSTTPAWAWVLFPLYGCYTALTDGVTRAWVADLVPAHSRATALGIQAAVSGIGLLVAGVWAGLAWNGTGHVPFVVSGVVVAVLAVVLVVFGRSWHAG
jgi:MFS family permease